MHLQVVKMLVHAKKYTYTLMIKDLKKHSMLILFLKYHCYIKASFDLFYN